MGAPAEHRRHPLALALLALGAVALIFAARSGVEPPRGLPRDGAAPIVDPAATGREAPLGPRRPEPVVVAREETEPPPPSAARGGVLTGLVRAPDGAPATVGLTVRPSWWTDPVPIWLPTGDDGRFRLALDEADWSEDPLPTQLLPAEGTPVNLRLQLDEGARASLALQLDGNNAQAVDPSLGRARTIPSMQLGPQAIVEFRWPAPGRDLDLGVLVLEHLPLLVGCRVVGAGPRPGERGGIEFDLCTRVDGEPLPHYRVEARDGTTELRGPWPEAAGSIQLRARDLASGGAVAAPLEVGLGTYGVLVEILAPSRLESRVTLLGGARPESLDAGILEAEPDPRPGWSLPPRVSRERGEDDLLLTVAPVRPGRHTLVLRLAGREVLRVDGVEFPPGAASPDPRLTRLVVDGR
jgi:hypothetical protein